MLTRGSSWGKLLAFYVGSIWLCLFIVSFIRAEDPIYIWDLAAYYEQFKSLVENFSARPWKTIKWFFQHSIQVDDYNSAPVILPSLLGLFFGTDRIIYTLSLAICYFLSLCWFIPTMFLKMTYRDSSPPPVQLWLCLGVTTILYIPFWKTLLIYLPDMVGLLPLLAAIYIAMTTNISERIFTKRMLLLGFCLYLSFLFRRWYAFSIVTFYLAYPLSMLLHIKSGNMISAVKNIFVNCACSGLVTLMTAIVLQYKFLYRIIQTDYSYSYSGYLGPRMVNINMLYEYTGLVQVMLVVGALAFCIWKTRDRIPCIFLALFTIILFIAFTSLQSFSSQHILPIAMAMLLLSFFCIDNIFKLVPQKWAKNIFCVIVAIVPMFSFSLVFSDNKPQYVAKLAPTLRIAPLTHPNYHALRSIFMELESRVTGTSDKIAVFSSNFLLSDSLITSNENASLASHVVQTAQVDKRDSIPILSILAKYAVTTDPIQYHLPASAQQVIAVPAKKLLSGTGIGQAYRILPKSYALSPSVNAYIYEKTRGFTTSEVRDFIASFPAEHSLWAGGQGALTATQQFLLQALVKVEQNSLWLDQNGNHISFGPNAPARLEFNVSENKAVQFELYMDFGSESHKSNVHVSVYRDMEELFSQDISSGENIKFDYDVSGADVLILQMDVGAAPFWHQIAIMAASVE